MSFLSRLLNLAGGKVSELTGKDDVLSDAELRDELSSPSPRPGPELTLRRKAPAVPEEDDPAPVQKRL